MSPCPLPERVKRTSEHRHRDRVAMNQNKVLTGSHPLVAENPEVPQPGFEPDMMSLKPLAAVEYISGLRKPRVDLPFEIK